MPIPYTYAHPSKETKSAQKKIFEEQFGQTQAQVKSLVLKNIKTFIRELAKKEYDLTYIQDNRAQIFDFFKNDGGVVVYFDKRGERSYFYPDSNKISLNLSNMSTQLSLGRFREYKAFEKDKIIGTLPIATWQDGLLVLTAHEFSHYVQHVACPKEKRFTRECWLKPHGHAFKTIYRHLRREIVNPKVGSN